MKIYFGRTVLAMAMIAGLTAGAFSPAVRADADSLAVTVSGTISESPCRINNNAAVSVEFGTVIVGALKGASASVPVTVDCAGQTPSGTLKLAFTGDTVSFSTTALKTSVDGLGITLSPPSGAPAGPGALTPGTYYDVTTLGLKAAGGTINLTAGLVSDATATLTGGEFTASATLVLQMV